MCVVGRRGATGGGGRLVEASGGVKRPAEAPERPRAGLARARENQAREAQARSWCWLKCGTTFLPSRRVPAKLTSHPEEASRYVAEGTPSVLVGEDAEQLGRLLRASPDETSRERLLGVMVGDLSSPAVRAAAEEMAESSGRGPATRAGSAPEAFGSDAERRAGASPGGGRRLLLSR